MTPIGPLLGRSQRRLEGRTKITGAAVYAADVSIPGLLHARLVLSPHAHARILRYDLAHAAGLDGVVDVVTAADLPDLGMLPTDEPLARREVLYAGQPVVAVVATTEEAAADAAALVDVEYEPLPAVIDPELAMAPGSPVVMPVAGEIAAPSSEHGAALGREERAERPPNCSALARYNHGDVEEELVRSGLVIEETYRLAAVHQAPLEPHVTVARVEADGSYTIWTSTQGIFLTREKTARALGVPAGAVRVEPTTIGGGFGGKLTPLLEPLVALLARRTRAPVRLCLSRTEEFLMGRGAPATSIRLRLGAGTDGRLLALQARLVFDCGAGLSGLGPLAANLLAGTYRIGAYAIECLDVMTNKTPVFAYRAPGAPQAYFALESAIDEIARRLRLDPIEVRLLNASRSGDPRPDGRPWPAIGLRDCLERARHHPLVTSPAHPGEGVGVAVGGVTGSTQPAAAGCRLDADGCLVLVLGGTDLTGTDTGLAMIAADAFGIPLERVRIERPDSGSAPFQGAAAGSKVTYVAGAAVLQAALEARRQLLEAASHVLEAAAVDLEVVDGHVAVRGVPSRTVAIGDVAAAAQAYNALFPPVQSLGRSALAEIASMFCVHLVRLRVDHETGAVAITGYAAIHDVGRAVNPAEIEGQVHGGVAQGMGRALGEELAYDQDGQLRSSSFIDYELPSVDQAPAISVELIEVPSGEGPLGARGVGEPPVVPPAAAISNAIRAATGIRITSLPIRAEVLVGTSALHS